ncbi:nicotinamidase/pyrazinamidase [Desulfonema ishimotonii]|uniref:Cysteine hydrolase n=1 Tax=Desulfonema ishimotonii TaxID=45657 RepID=A0A401FVJ7_9BACT|nr:hypothetical protein [Desulfonema ishimotonii]GBC60996.1 cysteine hydrolase [Desulfonema ishimotonii]GBC62799.1 nicotinamidase/pyrazinamidase [Desulfonema ishimotonii]
MEKIHLLIIDPQRDFCDTDGALAVPGADQDMVRLAGMIRRIEDKLWDIHCTLDTHHLFDISHPIFWVDMNRNHPAPFTIISRADVENGTWRTTNPQYQQYVLTYVSRLETNNRYPLCIWPPHCLIGSKGHNVVPVLADALMKWEENQVGMADYVTKGSNYKTEHYSAVQADVPDPSDPSTMLNNRLITTLEEADTILLAGEALSHCLRFTVEDIADTFDESHIRKMVLLADCASSVAGFEQQGEDFVNGMTARGMRISSSVDYQP